MKEKNQIEIEDFELNINKKSQNPNFNLNESKTMENSFHNSKIEENKNEQPIPNIFKIPESLKRTFYATVTLAGLGLVLFILGFIQDVAEHDPGKGITFWVLGCIVMIPGGYYSYQFYLAKKAEDESKRAEILDRIPEI